MKPWLGLGVGSVCVLPALMLGVTRCSSSSNGSGIIGGSSGGGSSSGGSTDAGGTPGTGPAVDGGGGPCPTLTEETVGAKVTLAVTWPPTLANNGGSGNINIWLLAQYTINGTAVTGTTATCGNQTPPIPLTPFGSQTEGLTSGTAVVQVGFAPSTWATILANPAKAPTTTSGTLGGWNIGSSFLINPTDSVYGLSASSMYSQASTTWPASAGTIPMGDLTDDDMDGHPGITGIPSSAMGFSLPSTAAQATPPYAPQADKLYLALRTELSLYGTSSSCTDISGSVGVQLLNNHVVGCDLADDGGDCTTPYSTGMVSGGQSGFIDSNTTVYIGPGVKIPASTPAASYTPPDIAGTFTAKILSTDGGGVTCADVLAAFPQ